MAEDRRADRLARVLWEAPVAFGFIDADLRYLQVNAALARMNGTPAEAHVGRTVTEVLGDTGLAVAENVRRVLDTGEAVTATVAGSDRHFLATYYPAPGPSVGVCVVEITEQQSAREAADRAVAFLGTLQEATDLLSDISTVEEVATVLLTTVAPRLGLVSAGLCLLCDDGFSTVASVGFHPDSVARWTSFGLDDDVPLNRVAAEGDLVVLGSIAERDERFPATVGIPSTSAALAYVPLEVEGEVLGVLTLGWPEPRQFRDDERAFLAAIGHQCAQAVERARLAAAERVARERLHFLAEASSALATSLDYGETLANVARLAVPEVADTCTVYVVDGADLVLVAAAHADAGKEPLLWEVGGRRHPIAGHALAQAVEMDPILLPQVPDDILVRVARSDEHLAALRALSFTSSMLAPLRAAGRFLGLVTVATGPDRRPFDDDDLGWFGDLAARASVAVDNARLYRDRTAAGQTLQRSLLPPTLPSVPGLQVAARYHPVGDGSEVGGDFYDVFPIGGDRWGVVMGDASGKGVAAATLTALARYTVRAAALQEDRPSRVLAVLNQAIVDADVGERFCTIVHACLEPAGDGMRVRFSSGGHPPPLLLRQNGAVEPVGRAGTLIGLFPVADLVDDEVVLAPGESLVLYTDGLIEARSPDGAWGYGLLEEALAGGAGLDASRLASRVEDAVLRFEGGRPRDDMALLVLRVPTADEVATGEGVRERLPAHPEAAPLARSAVRPWLAGQEVTGDAAEDVVLVVSELVTNAARAARGGVELRAWRSSQSLVVEITDDGPGFVPPVHPPSGPSPEAEEGRGLYLARSLCSELDLSPGPWGTVIRARFDL